MKILLVADYAVPVAGAEISTLRLRDGLRARGHDVRVFASTAHESDGSSFADYRCFGTTGFGRTLLQACNPLAFLRLRRVLRTFRPDAVSVGIFLTQLSPLILPLLKGVPTVHRAHWRRAICPVGTKQLPGGDACAFPWGVACLRSRCLPLHDWLPLMIQMKLWWRWREVFDHTAANSAAIANSLEQNGLSGVAVIHAGTEDRTARPPLQDPPTIAFAGRLVPKKGVDVFLRAMEQVCAAHPRARALIAGDGPETVHVRRWVEDSSIGDRVRLCGHLEPAELESRLAPAWVQVVPSRYEEPFGLVAIEAMMRGTAVVASRVGGLTEIVVDGETGCLVPPEDEAALANALIALIRDRERAERMGAAARRRAIEHFTTDLYIDRFAEVFESLTGGQSNA